MRKPKKIAGYLRALELIKKGAPQYEACEKAGLSRMTFNKYREIFGDEIAPNLVEVLAPETRTIAVKTAPVVESSLDKIIRENAAMVENLRLKRELGLIQ